MQRKYIKFKLYRLSKMIPIFCILAFLGICTASINPTINQASYALEDAAENTQDNSEENPDDTATPSKDALDTETSTTDLDVTTEDETNNDTGEVNYDDLISPLSENSALNMTITNLDMAATEVPADGMAYRSHNVTVTATDVSSYSLTISYAEANGAMRLNEDQNVVLANATGTNMTTMAEGSWGWAWSNSLASGDEAGLTYYGMPKLGTYANSLANGLLENAAPTDYNATFTKRLVFGAKFGKDDFSGTYHTSAMLSLAAVPKFAVGLWQLPDGTTKNSGILTMQSMTADVCKQVDAPTSNNPKQVPLLVLRDTRGGGYTNDNIAESYIVGRLRDGNCWMVQNMNLTNKEISSNDSNIPKDGDNVRTYTIPAHSTSGWSTSDGTSKKVYYTNAANPDADTNKYGAYYTWCAATASTCVNSGEAAGSICPKGWKLPTSNKANTVNGSFNKLVMDGSSQITPANAWKTDQTDTTLGNSFGIVNPTNGAVFGAAFFPAAGYVRSGSLSGVGSLGYYWSSTASSSTGAYTLYFNSGYVDPSYYIGRDLGLSVRCVAPSS